MDVGADGTEMAGETTSKTETKQDNRNEYPPSYEEIFGEQPSENQDEQQTACLHSGHNQRDFEYEMDEIERTQRRSRRSRHNRRLFMGILCLVILLLLISLTMLAFVYSVKAQVDDMDKIDDLDIHTDILPKTTLPNQSYMRSPNDSKPQYDLPPGNIQYYSIL